MEALGYRVAAVVREAIPCVEVYVVGSSVRGDSTGGSDVNILVVSPYMPEKLGEKVRGLNQGKARPILLPST